MEQLEKRMSSSPLVHEEVSIASLDLPQEIIVEILLRSPVKSLLQFKCVSKSWCSEISSPGFAKTHVKVSSKNKRISNYGLLCHISSFPHVCSLDEEAHEITPLQRNCINWGCCNGWICYSKEVDKKPILWNPSTRKFLQFRSSETYIEIESGKGKWTYRPIIVYGFGYDEFTDDYKVIEIVEPLNPCTISIYSLRKNYWKRLRDCPKGLNDYSYLVNGALHWEAYHKHNLKSSDNPNIIFSINLSRETYQELDFPEHQVLSIKQMNTRIGILRDCLSASFDYFFSRVDVWIMKEYGVKESWYKFVSVPHILVTGIVFMQRCTPPLWLFENGKILLIHEHHMRSYNPRDNKFKSCFGSDDQWRKRYVNKNKSVIRRSLHNLSTRPECYVQSLIDLP